jgi:hypothetical protein
MDIIGFLLKVIFGIGGAASASSAYERQVARLQKQYKITRRRIKEYATVLTGQQQAALAVMGQAGGEGTAGAGILAQTEARRKEDLGLLKSAYEDALADLRSQYAASLLQQTGQSAMDIAGAVKEMGAIATQFAALPVGMAGSLAAGSEGTINMGNLLDMEKRYYTWGLLK